MYLLLYGTREVVAASRISINGYLMVSIAVYYILYIQYIIYIYYRAYLQVFTGNIHRFFNRPMYRCLLGLSTGVH